MSDRVSSPEDKKPSVVFTARQPWVRPTLTRMTAADAEVGTRPNVADGNYSVS
jgi:hypothetical protein